MSTWALLSFQDSAAPSMEQLILFHDFTMATLTFITVLVSLSILFMFMYSSTDRHLLQDQYTEIVWTLAPVFVLLFIALPSLSTLYLLDDPFSPNLTIKAVGHQWYWSYEYSDFPNIEFDSYMTPQDETATTFRLLETDNSLVLPIFTQVRVITTGADVIHSWTVPALGVFSMVSVLKSAGLTTALCLLS